MTETRFTFEKNGISYQMSMQEIKRLHRRERKVKRANAIQNMATKLLRLAIVSNEKAEAKVNGDLLMHQVLKPVEVIKRPDQKSYNNIFNEIL